MGWVELGHQPSWVGWGLVAIGVAWVLITRAPRS
jgi:hypothetical protein